jgi:hypothetical protein
MTLYLDVHAQYTFSIISEIYILFNYSELGIILNFIVLYDSVYIPPFLLMPIFKKTISVPF